MRKTLFLDRLSDFMKTSQHHLNDTEARESITCTPLLIKIFQTESLI